MADIKKELNDIKNAVYGKEVRGSIHDGIKKINDEVEDATDLSESAKHQVENIQQQVNQLVVEGDSSVEAAQARVDAEGKSYPTLKARLDAKETEFSSQLAQTENVRFNYENKAIEDVRPNGQRRCIVSFITDDGWDEDYTILKPILEPLGVPCSMALVPGYPRQITDEHIQEALSLGWDFGSHTVNHKRLPDLTPEEIDYELRESKRMLEERGLNIEYLVYPGNQENALVRSIARKYYKFAMKGNNSPVDYPARTYQIERVTMGAYFSSPEQATLDWYKSKFDEAYAQDKWIIYMLHAAHPDFDSTQRQHLVDLIQYIQSHNVPIKTVGEAYKEMGNLITIGDGDHERFGITNTGEVYGSPYSRLSTQMGFRAEASGLDATAIGGEAKALENKTIALGMDSLSTGNRSIAIGNGSQSIGASTVAIGRGSEASDRNGIAIGNASYSDSLETIAIGFQARTNGDNAISLGKSSSANIDAVSIGNSATSESNGLAIGYNTTAANNSVALGVSSQTPGTYAVSVGSHSQARGTSSSAFGRNAIADKDNSTALGRNASALGDRSTAIGWNAEALYDDEMVLGGNTTKPIIPHDAIYLRNPKKTQWYRVRLDDNGNVVTEPVSRSAI